MSESKSASRRSLGSNLIKVAKHRICDEEYVELSELTDDDIICPLFCKSPFSIFTPSHLYLPPGRWQ